MLSSGWWQRRAKTSQTSVIYALIPSPLIFICKYDYCFPQILRISISQNFFYCIKFDAKNIA